ncbi:MAG: tRNA uridine-5-carboxymethylaminomethyl(34) synthesis GTPase MnmE [Gemmatimonadota bacterium]
MLTDPIAALATPPGRSALAIVRLSGTGAFGLAAKVVPSFKTDPPRTARLARLVDREGHTIDRGLYLVYPAPHSATGEDLVEFSCHGGLMVPARLLEALHSAGARPAAPGEFTRRAVLNGKLDLLQAEAVGDLIEASAPAQAGAALHQMEGGLSRRIAALREDLLDLESLLAYDIDFPEEDDGPLSRARIETRRLEVAASIDRMLASAPAGERLREGALVVLTGAPNAGKSSLFNALLGSTRALVTEVAGTTRDAIEAHTDFLGWPVRLVDTAGISAAPDRLEAMGMEMSARYLEKADLVLECVECGSGDGGMGRSASFSASPASPASPRPVSSVLVRTKSDLGTPHGDGLYVSAITGHGLDQLRRTAGELLFGSRLPLAELEPALTRARHRDALAKAQSALADAREHLLPGGDAVLVAHHVRQATRALDELVGTVDLEQILDRVFAGFCVGK